MNETTHEVIGQHPLVAKYLARVPEDIRDLLTPSVDQIGQFAAAVKALRLKEEERYYVLHLQRRHGLPIRPTETVKETMIRARLTILRKRREGVDEDELIDPNDPLPVDPLE
jgi:hypothetical protein